MDTIMRRVDEFIEAYPQKKLTLSAMVTGQGDFPQSLKNRELTYATAKEAAEYNITRVPTTIIRDGRIIYKIVGAVNILDYRGMKTEEKTALYRLLAETGPSCPVTGTAYGTGSIQRIQLPSFPVKPITLPKFTLPRADEQRTFSVPVAAITYAPFTKYFVISEVELSAATKLFKKGYLGCCTDCTKFNLVVSPCSEDILRRFHIQATPALLDIDFKKGTAQIKEGTF